MKLKRGASCGGTRPQQQQFSASPVYTKSEKEASVVAINLINSNANNFPVCIAFYSFLCSGHMTTLSNQNLLDIYLGDLDNIPLSWRIVLRSYICWYVFLNLWIILILLY